MSVSAKTKILINRIRYFCLGRRPKKIYCPGFYFQQNPATVFFSTGRHLIPRSLLADYRDAVAKLKLGSELKGRINKVLQNKELHLSDKSSKKYRVGMMRRFPKATCYFIMV